MTNEEKAREFATELELSNSPNKEHFARDIYSGAILMAQWKDMCFRDVITHLREAYQLDQQVLFVLDLVESRYNDKKK